ncbi:hypothetical protein ACVR1I_10405 [Streptococcus cameli]
MKKLKCLLFLPLFFIMVACGQNPKDEFLSRLEKQQTQKQVSYDYTIKLDDVMTSDAKGMDATISSFVGKAIDATISQDLDENLIYASVDLSSINPMFSSFEMVYADDKAYMTAAPMLAMSGITSSKIDGKYVDIEEMSGEKLPAISDFTPNNKENAKVFKELDSKKFTKDGDKVSVTMTVEELFDMAQKAMENGDKQNKSDTKNVEKQLSEAKETFSKDSTFVMTLDKKQNGKALLTLKSAENKKDNIKISITFTKKDYKAPILPAKEDILTKDELLSLMMESYSGN